LAVEIKVFGDMTPDDIKEVDEFAMEMFGECNNNSSIGLSHMLPK
jgi:hypothetical protein